MIETYKCLFSSFSFLQYEGLYVAYMIYLSAQNIANFKFDESVKMYH